MASAQVMSNSGTSSRKQGHLEAGKRRLEEFRKKKAEGRNKKITLTGQQQSTDVSQDATHTLESGSNRLFDLDGSVTSERDETSTVARTSDNEALNLSNTSSSVIHGGLPQSDGNHNASNVGKRSIKDLTSKEYQGSELHLNFDHQEKDNNFYPNPYYKSEEKQTNITDESVPLNLFHGIGLSDGNLPRSSHHATSEAQFEREKSRPNEVPGTLYASVASNVTEKHSDTVQSGAGFANTSASAKSSVVLNEDSVPSTTSFAGAFPRAELSNGSMIFDAGRMKLTRSINQEPSTDGAQWKSSESLSSGFSFDFRGSSNHIPLSSVTSETGNRKNRSSFLDSINVPRASPSFPSSFSQAETTEPYSSRSSETHSSSMVDSSASGQPFTNNVSIGSFDKLRSPNVPDMYGHGMNSMSVTTEDEMRNQGFRDSIKEWNHEVPTVKKDDNFAALEQYIEDLTQEKFSLKRDLEASRALAESLAAENSSLTDSYNQQRAAVNQLKSDMERLQAEIKANLLELDSVKMEYANAQLECNAADERAKILASEVIGLEEKALKLRSSELKLERQLENSNAEINSYKKKVSSLQKERQDLQSTINALQEEKKLMQAKLRKAAGNVKSLEVIKNPSSVKNVSTSTEDLGFEISDPVPELNTDVDTTQNTSHFGMQNGELVSSGASSSYQFPENRELHFAGSSAAIPPDQLKMIGNINSLISELALEKEELMRSLSSESSNSSKLKELNKELSRKLEVQTQRLELLTAQSMANENVLGRQTDPLPANDSISYTDEGDEVVERVLGWIMKLFPGGPAKRRTRRLL